MTGQGDKIHRVPVPARCRRVGAPSSPGSAGASPGAERLGRGYHSTRCGSVQIAMRWRVRTCVDADANNPQGPTLNA